MANIQIGLLGLGTVGTAVVRLLAANRQLIEEKAGASVTVKRALVRNPDRTRDLGGAAVELTADPQAVVADPHIDLVIELMGGTGQARELILQALRAGKSVVTANKDLMAEHGAELFAAAKSGGSEIYFEASVGGGIPIIRPLKESLGANRISSILGIMNGTTNYILTKMSQEGKPFDEALREAQALGYAEADPTADVGGFDAARKLAILASIGFLSRVTPAQVFTEGITSITPRDIEAGQRFGWALKLLGIAKEQDGVIEARVHPTFVSRRHPLAHVNGSLNAIFVTGDAVGDTMFYGRGAGGDPTASSIMGDVIAAVRWLVLRSALRALPASSEGLPTGTMGCTCYHDKPMRPMTEVESRFYLRLTVLDRPGVLAKVAGAFGTAQVSIERVLQGPVESEAAAELVLVTHRVAEGRMNQALELLRSLPEVSAVQSRIRIETDD